MTAALDTRARPLTPLQAGILFHSRLDPGAGIYIQQILVRWPDDVDSAALQSAWRLLLDRHPILRTSFQLNGDPATQSEHDSVTMPFVELDWRAGGGDLERFLADDRAAGFDPAQAPLSRVTVIRAGERDWSVVWTFHHALLDGRSHRRILEELFAAYDAFRAGEHPSLVPLRSFDAHLDWLESTDLSEAEKYWRQLLAGFESPTCFPTIRSTGSAMPGGFRECVRQLAAITIRDCAARRGVTPTTLIHGVWAIVLARYAGETDVVFGVTRSGRRSEIKGVDSTVGLLINTVPMRVNVDGAQTVSEFLAALREQSLAARPNDHAGPLDIQHGSEVPAGTPLYDSLVVVENYRLQEALAEQNSAWANRQVELRERPHYPVALSASIGSELDLKLMYDRSRVDDAGAERLLGHVAALLEAFVAAGDATRLADLPMLSPAEERQLTREWNATDGDFPCHRRIEQLFESQVERAPDAIAVLHEHQVLTYGQLEARANRLAHHLQSIGVRAGDRVAICMNRSAEMIVAMLGILKVGAAYVPLDPAYPKERLAFLLQDTGSAALLTQVRRVERLPELSIPVVCLDADWPTIAANSAGRPARLGKSSDLAYIIYTSGSTGAPKGVMLSHRAVVNTLDWVNTQFAVCPDDRVLFVTSICFDLSVYDVFGILAAGGSIRVATGSELRDPERLLAVLQNEPITIWDSAPSLLNALAPHFRPEPQSKLRLVLLSGDWIPVALPDRVRAAFPTARVISLGGATEAAIWSNWFPIERVDPNWTSIPYGRPIRNARYYLLDIHCQPAPIGVPAELFIGGDCLADGYWNRPELTAERFVDGRFGRLYRTGDRARFWSDGTIEFLGRVDQQVKIRGFRIELGEVEASLAQNPDIASAVVAIAGDKNGERKLSAYVVPKPGCTTSIRDWREFLAARLPDWMIPSNWVSLDALPLNRNGKVDRRRLPALGGKAANHEVTPPRNPTESALIEIWREVLGRDQIGVHDHFFELGGHSLKAAQVVSRVRQRLGRELPLAGFLNRPTIAAAATLLQPLTPNSLPPGPPASETSALALPTQRQLWFLHQLGQGVDVYTIAYSLKHRGPLEDEAVQAALSALVKRHDGLRVSLHEIDGKLMQRVSAAHPIDLPITDLSVIPAAERSGVAKRLADDFTRRPFDLSCGPLWRAHLVRGADEQRLLLEFHHAIVDGESVNLLVRELVDLITDPMRCSSAALSLIEFSGRRNPISQDLLDFWQGELTPLPAPLELPFARRRPSTPSWRGAECPLKLDPDTARAIADISRRENVTTFVTLLAALEVLLSRLTTQSDFAIGVPVVGRSEPGSEAIVGPLINTVVLRADVADNPSFRELLNRVRRRVHGALTHDAMPFDELVRALHPPRDASPAPLFQVLFSQSAELTTIGEWTATPLSTGTAKFDLSLWIQDGPNGPHGHFEYSTDLFKSTAIERLATQFRTLLSAALVEPATPIDDLPLMSSAEEYTVTVEWNATVRAFPRDRCVQDLIAEQVARTPDRVAVALDDRALSYAEMDRQANQLARYLRSLGVGPDVPVGLYLDRSPTMIVAALAVWKAGGAYLPLDPTFPAERIEFYIRDSKARVVIGIGTPNAKLRLPTEVAEVSLHGDREQIEQNPTEPPSPTSRPENLAYVIYTSGSTGAPKGVAVQHSALVNLLTSMADESGLCADDVMLGLTTMSFDIHALELWLPLLIGARVELVDRDVATDGLQLARKLKSTRPTVAQATPTTWRMLRAAGWDGDPNLKVLCGGETMPPDLAADLVGRVRELWNMYGPTETTVWSTLHRVTSAEGPIPIGRPIANTQIFILDEQHQPLPPGVVGELAIGGAGLARGYLNRPELTAERFIDSRFGRLYLTGDRARWRDDGVLEFLGRTDQQVKLRGHRIELAEIESALARYPAVEHAVAALRNDRLVAYIVPRPATRPNLDELRQSLRQLLPEPMVPTHIVLIEALPKTKSGKLNRAALPAPEAVPDRQQIAPRFDIERDLAAVWEEVLDVRPIGVTDDFFELGGHSYLAAVLLARIQQRLGHTLPLGALFAAPTVEKLAVVLQQRLETGSGSSLIALRDEGRRPPLFLIAGVGGHVFAFHKFARLLGPDQPAYGVKAIGVDGVTQPPDRIDQIAARYAEEITRERPTGPVVLGGYSIGAIAAFELALQLQQAGREVGPLVVFDMTAPGYPKLKSLPKRIFIHAGNVLRGNGAGRGAYLRERLTNLRGRVFDALGLTRWNAPQLDVASLPQDALQRVWVALREAQRHYRPSRQFAGRVILFKAAEVPAWAAAAFDDPDLGWGEWATGGVECVTIPGGHLDMFRENNLESLAAMLRERLK